MWGIENQLPILSCQHHSGKGLGFTLSAPRSGRGEEGMKISCMLCLLKLESSRVSCACRFSIDVCRSVVGIAEKVSVGKLPFPQSFD